MRTPLMLVLLAAVSALGGCASVSTLREKDACKVYGGTRLDATLISEGMSADSEMAKSKAIARPVLFQEGCCGLVDLPFSFVADTVMLPFTVPVSAFKSRPDSHPVEEAPLQEEPVAEEMPIEE